MRFEPRPYQQRMIDMLETDKSVALWADMGLGKTVTVLTAISDRIYDRMTYTKALVIAPPLVAEDTWPGEIEKWDHLKHLRIASLDGSPKERAKVLERIDEYDVFTMSRNKLPWLFDQYVKWNVKKTKWNWAREWPFNVVAIDEASAFKSPSGEWFKTMARIRRTGCQVIEMTGTPSPNGAEDLWAQTYLLDLGERLTDGITKFRQKFMMQTGTIYAPGGRQVPKWGVRPGGFEDIMRRMGDIAVSFVTDDWITLPRRIDNNVRVKLPPAVMKQYDTMLETAVLRLSDAEVITAGSEANIVGKLLQMANGRVYDEMGGVHILHREKQKALKAKIDEADGPVLVFYSYRHDIDAIMEELPGAVILEGTKQIQSWNRREIPVLIAHPASAGHGLNMQFGGNTIIWYGLPYNLEWYQQANKRVHRSGQQADHVIIHHIVAEGTRDMDVVRALNRKGATQQDIIDAVRYV